MILTKKNSKHAAANNNIKNSFYSFLIKKLGNYKIEKQKISHVAIFFTIISIFSVLVFSMSINNNEVRAIGYTANQKKTIKITSSKYKNIKISGSWSALSFDDTTEVEREKTLEDKIDDRNPPAMAGNGYVAGQCTWYAYNRRAELGIPIGGNWGNAGQWPWSAMWAGYSVNHSPQVGDVFVESGWSYYGHVAIVEEVGPNNTVRISEMNYGGPYNWNTRWVSDASAYTYIH